MNAERTDTATATWAAWGRLTAARRFLFDAARAVVASPTPENLAVLAATVRAEETALAEFQVLAKMLPAED